MALRFDKSTLARPQRQSNGWLRADAFLTRTGVFEYLDGSGGVRRELRLPEHVFALDSLASFGMVPITNDHPEALLDASNTQKYQRGQLGSDVRREGDHVRASLLVTDAALVTLIEEGKSELSCGYDCDLAMTPGEWQGLKYDAVQTNIRGNHVAVVDRGRAGPTARINMDAASAFMVRRDEGKQMAMVKVTIGGTEMEVSEELAQQILAFAQNQGNPTAGDPMAEDKKDSAALRAELARERAEHSKVRGERDAFKGKLDQATSVEAEAKKKKDQAELESRVKKQVRDRMALEQIAREHLGDDTDVSDKRADRDLQLAVIAKHSPTFKADGLDDLYVRARFDATVEHTSADEGEDRDPLSKVRRDADPDPETEAGGTIPNRGHVDESRLDSDGRRDRMVEKSADAWKTISVGLSKRKS